MSADQVLTAAEPSLVAPSAQVFSLNGTALLTKGRTQLTVAKSDGMTARIKVYAEGGENATHAHRTEDHLFLVLQGEATFLLGRDGEEVRVITAMEGILIPKGAYYRFQSSGDENLVLFRTGTHTDGPERMDTNGAPLLGDSEENHYVVGVPAEGKFFSAK